MSELANCPGDGITQDDLEGFLDLFAPIPEKVSRGSKCDANSPLEPARKLLAPESEGLEPIVGSWFSIGDVDDINGPGAELIDFKPTRAELMTLAYDYLGRYFSVEETHAMGASGSWEMRESAFSWRRFVSIAETLSPGVPLQEFKDYIAKRAAEVESLRVEFEREHGATPKHAEA